MKILKSILLVIALFAFGCEKDAGNLDVNDPELDEPAFQNCKPGTEYYFIGKVFGNIECWNNGGLYDIGAAGTGACGKGYENYYFPYMALGVYAQDNNTNGRRITLEIPFNCDDFSTKAKFYDLLKVGNYGYQKVTKTYGKFSVTYEDANGYYSTDYIDQGNKFVEIIQVDKVYLPGGTGYGSLHHALKVKMKINCTLADSYGKAYGTFRNVEVSGITYRQHPWGEIYPDWDDPM